MKIAMIASEANPLCKTGGLADVVYALSHELQKKGEEVIVILPYYSSIASKGFKLKSLGGYGVAMNWRNAYADLWTTEAGGVKFFLIGNGNYFMRESLYGYPDDGERFAFFSLAAVELLRRQNFQPDIIHVHDWQTAMIPTLVKHQHAGQREFANTHFVLTIHNPAFKGMLDPYSLMDLYNLPYRLYESGEVRFEGRVSTLKAGIVASDKITTVSPTHREELLSPYTGQGLQDVLRMREYDFCGFVNGIDVEEWDPANDSIIDCPFDSRRLVRGKEENKKAFLEKAGMKDDRTPLFGLVSRLTFQKGIDLVLDCAPELLERGAKLAILGSGEFELEQRAEALRRRYPHQVYLYIGYNNKIAHKIYASSDFFLMPSLFEPCGIGQLIALRYATLPVARDTGGLHDTIEDYREDNLAKATGVLFRDYNFDGLRYGLSKALQIYADKKTLHQMMHNALKVDNSWANSAELYAGLYRSLLEE